MISFVDVFIRRNVRSFYSLATAAYGRVEVLDGGTGFFGNVENMLGHHVGLGLFVSFALICGQNSLLVHLGLEYLVRRVRDHQPLDAIVLCDPLGSV